ncbi:MAG: hypothetical protein WCZ65_01220 [Lysobacteraceae bacterium]
MSDLRTLLIECRVALRGSAVRGVQTLLQRIEVTLSEIGKGVQVGQPGALSHTAQQVALAWQTVARGLKLSHPELYEDLNQRVMALLDTRTLEEPTDELLKMEVQIAETQRESDKLSERFEQLQDRLHATQRHLDDLHKALAAAVPEGHGKDAQTQALNRLEALVTLAQSPSAGGGDGAARGLSDNPAPTRAQLERVADGDASFTKEQRDWLIGEALGLTGWAYTPVELIEQGDQWLATLVLEKGQPA